jgi:alpha/beta superfamily hydrolase
MQTCTVCRVITPLVNHVIKYLLCVIVCVLGMNVCVFNYRGYGASSGVPDPTRIQNDGAFVANYLTDSLHVNTLLLHGESVGGLVACHIAKNCRVAGEWLVFVVLFHALLWSVPTRTCSHVNVRLGV